jgi:hypothetical protein
MCHRRVVQHGKREAQHEEADFTGVYLSLRTTQLHTGLQEKVNLTIAKFEWFGFMGVYTKTKYDISGLLRTNSDRS